MSIDLFTGEAAGQSYSVVAVSRDGRYIAFDSYASTLVAGDTNAAYDIFVRDRLTGVTERVSAGLGGVEANGDSRRPSISGDGRYVTFNSMASNLVASDDNEAIDLFRYDRSTGLTMRVNVESTGVDPHEFWDADISDDGRFVVYADGGAIVLRDLQAQTTRAIHVGPDEYTDQSNLPLISGNGRFVLYRSDPEFALFVYDRWTGSKEIVPDSDYFSSASISPDGRFIAYVRPSNSRYPPDRIYLLDRQTRVARGVSLDAAGRWLDDGMQQPSVSDDGRYVAFQSNDYSLEIYVKDMSTGHLDYVTGAQRQYNTAWPSLSGDGRYLGFPTTFALVPVDRNADSDVYLHEVNAASPPQTFQYRLRPLARDYGSVKVGATLRKGFTLSNVGEAALPISVIELLGPDRVQFQMRSYCGSALAVGQRCWISVTFAPNSAGAKQANLHVVAGGIQKNRALRGTGTP